MKTTRAISTISYNTDSFLIAKLTDLLNQHFIDFWCYIEHLPESDELKKHKHVYIQPSKAIDTFWLQSELQEPDLQNPGNKPLGIITCNPSKFGDWYLYAKHDRNYIKAKFMDSKKYNYHYDDKEFVCSDYDAFHEYIHSADLGYNNKFAQFTELVMNGVPFRQMVKDGFIPINQIRQYQYAYDVICNRIVVEGEPYAPIDYSRNNHLVRPIHDSESLVSDLSQDQIDTLQNIF